MNKTRTSHSSRKHQFKGGAIRAARKAASVEANRRKAEEFARLMPHQQLMVLDIRLGPNVGAKKQRARIMRALEGGAR